MLERLTRFSILELLLAVPICAVFLIANLIPNNGESEFTLFDSTTFNQYMRRGWPFDYQVEFDIDNFDGRPIDIRRNEFATNSTTKVSSIAAAFANLAVIAAILGIGHITFAHIQRPVTAKENVGPNRESP